MDRKQIGMDRRCQSAVMCVVMAFSFCLFLWIFAVAAGWAEEWRQYR